MTTKTFAALSLFASVFSANAFAQVQSSTETLPVTGTEECPKEILVGIQGESIVQGLRYTVDVNRFIAPGAKLRLQGVDATTFVFQAELAGPFKPCVGLSKTMKVFNELTTMFVAFEEGSVWVQLQMGPSLNLNLTSTFNNQAIFDLAEDL